MSPRSGLDFIWLVPLLFLEKPTWKHVGQVFSKACVLNGMRSPCITRIIVLKDIPILKDL